MKKLIILLLVIFNLSVLTAKTRISILNTSPPGILAGEQTSRITTNLETLIQGNAFYTLIEKTRQEQLLDQSGLPLSGPFAEPELKKICRQLEVKNILLWEVQQKQDVLQLTIQIYAQPEAGIRYNIIKNYKSFSELASGLSQVLDTILMSPEFSPWSAHEQSKKALNLYWGSELYSTPLLNYSALPGLLLGISVNLSYKLALVVEGGFNMLSIATGNGEAGVILGELPVTGSLRLLQGYLFLEARGGLTFCDSTGPYKGFSGRFFHNTRVSLRGGIITGRLIFYLEAGALYMDQRDLQPCYGIGFLNLLY